MTRMRAERSRSTDFRAQPLRAETRNVRRIAILCCLLLANCGQSETDRLREENQELHEQVQQLQNQLAEVKVKAGDLKTASDALQEQLQRFGSENWKDVMPEAQDAGEEVAVSYTL